MAKKSRVVQPSGQLFRRERKKKVYCFRDLAFAPLLTELRAAWKQALDSTNAEYRRLRREGRAARFTEYLQKHLKIENPHLPPSEIEELTQEAMKKTFRYLVDEKCGLVRFPHAYLRRAARGVIGMRKKGKITEQQVEIDTVAPVNEREYDADEVKLLLEKVNLLRPILKEAVVLFLQGKSFVNIGKNLGITRQSAHERVLAAISILRRQLIPV